MHFCVANKMIHALPCCKQINACIVVVQKAAARAAERAKLAAAQQAADTEGAKRRADKKKKQVQSHGLKGSAEAAAKLDRMISFQCVLECIPTKSSCGNLRPIARCSACDIWGFFTVGRDTCEHNVCSLQPSGVSIVQF